MQYQIINQLISTWGKEKSRPSDYILKAVESSLLSSSTRLVSLRMNWRVVAMIQWENTVKERTINWLLEETNPSVRYFTLRDILDKREDDPQVLAAKHLIPESRIVKEILRKQNPRGYWMEPANPYHPKYKSSYWTIMILGQLGMNIPFSFSPLTVVFQATPKIGH
jgi:hypothetical protein